MHIWPLYMQYHTFVHKLTRVRAGYWFVTDVIGGLSPHSAKQILQTNCLPRRGGTPWAGKVRQAVFAGLTIAVPNLVPFWNILKAIDCLRLVLKRLSVMKSIRLFSFSLN